MQINIKLQRWKLIVAKIRNTMVRNSFGDGYEKEVILDNGETYIIRNSMATNAFGGGYEQEIIKKDEAKNCNTPVAFVVLLGILAVFAFCILWGLMKMFDITLIIIGIVGIVATFIIFGSKNLQDVKEMLLLLLQAVGLLSIPIGGMVLLYLFGTGVI